MKLLLLTLTGCLFCLGATARQHSNRSEQSAATASEIGSEFSPARTTVARTPVARTTVAHTDLTRGAQSSDPRNADTPVAPAQDKAPQGPLMLLPDPVHDFGDVPRKGGDVAHDFIFRNEGDRPLVVLRVVTSCSCVKASFSKRPVAPGQTGVIRIVYEPHKSEPGAFNKVIQVFSNSVGGRDLVTVQGRSIEKPQKVKFKNEKLKIK